MREGSHALQIFAGFTFQHEELAYTIGGMDKAKQVRELIISN